jgi:4-alpha-glucanotransferase
VGLNPLHDIPNRHPFNISPYLPNSAFYRNCLYLDPERLEDFRNSPRAQTLLAQPQVQAELETLRTSPHVLYERVQALKLRVLKLCFLAFLKEFRQGGARSSQFEEFLRQEGELLDRFAIHCALAEWLHARQPELWVWPDWPEPLRDPNSEAVGSFARRHWRAVLFYKYVQWLVDLQLAAVQQHARRKGLHIGLYHDLALAADRCGADLWAHRDFFVSGCRVGAPPDGFAPKGQDWSFPPPNSRHHRATGYQLFRESIRKNCRHGGALRIDHVMRFFRLYWIPEGLPPTHGAYVRESYQDLLHIVALESVRNQVAIVGEDLGTVTPEIRQALDHFAIFRYRVLYFEKDDRNEFRLPHEYPAEALVSSSTHDLPTLAGFWLARDIEARHHAGLLTQANYHTQLAERAGEKQQLLDVLLRLGLLPDWVPRSAVHIPELTGELHNALVGFLAITPCRLLTLNQEDLTKETEQQNLPASTWQYPNWQRKMRFTLEELRTSPLARDFTRMFRNWLLRSARLP